ncbi:MAG: twin-arginine translocation signal domain-containing protein [Thermomicrobiales bacterium]|nr:twin-arginine translocation signal domain-containing protein [Thermomicrobiales bacterium]
MTRRGFLGALATGIGSLLVIVVLWLIARGSPSSRREPGYVLPDPMPTKPAAPATSTP